MSNVTREQAEQLIAREQRGEDLSAAEWSSLAAFHAGEAVRHAQSGVRWAAVSIGASVVAVAVLLVARVLS